MKKHFFNILFLIVLSVNLAQAQILTGFGSAQFNPFNASDPTIDPSSDFISPWSGTASTTALTVTNVSNAFGGIYDTLPTPVSIVGNTNFLDLTGTLTTTPVQPHFQIVLYDNSGDFNSLTYDFNWNSFSSGGTTVSAPLVSTSGNFSGIVGSWSLNLFGAPTDTVSFVFNKLSSSAEVVPEPSTYLLLFLGMSMLFLLRFFYLRHGSSLCKA